MTTNKLYQLFKDNITAGCKVKAEVKENTAVVYLYDAIGGWFGVEAKDFVKELNDLDVDSIELHINSPGGDVFEARAITTAISRLDAKITAHIDGVCASAATYIALACDSVEMAEGGFFMIHNAWTLALGNADELRQTANLLEKVDATILADYQRKTGLNESELRELMHNETWFTAEEAKERGFVDEIYTGGKVENRWNLDAYNNSPEQLKASVEVDDDYERELFERRLNLIQTTNA